MASQRNKAKRIPKAAKPSSLATEKAGIKIPTAMLPKDLYTDIVRLTAYNKLKKTGPQSDSALLREALHAVINYLGFEQEKTNILAAPSSSYVNKLCKLHEDSTLEGGIRKTFSISAADYEAAEALTSYNKLHGLLPKNLSQLCRDALMYYLGTIDYEFRPEE